MHAASDPAASVFVVSTVPPLVSAGVGQNNVSPAPAQTLLPNLGSSAPELTSLALSALTGSVSLGTDIVPPKTNNPQLLFFFFQSSDGWVKIKLKLPHFHISDTCRVSI